MTSTIYSMVCRPDNTGAYINDYSGAVRMIKWNQNASKKYEFDITKQAKRGAATKTKHICYEKDSKKIFVCTKDMIRLCCPLTLSATKDYETYWETKKVMQIKNGKQILIASEGHLEVLNLETFRCLMNCWPLNDSSKVAIEYEGKYPVITSVVV